MYKVFISWSAADTDGDWYHGLADADDVEAVGLL